MILWIRTHFIASNPNGIPAICQDLSAAELRDLARKESDARVSRRLLGLAMALDGIGRGEAARQAGMDRQALRDWVIDTMPRALMACGIGGVPAGPPC